MKLTPVDSIPKRKRYNTKIESVIEEFKKMDTFAVELDWQGDGYKSVRSPVSAFNNTIKRLGYNMKYVIRGDRAFLVKFTRG